MMLTLFFLSSCLICAAPPPSDQSTVRHILVEGVRRIPPATVLHYVSAHPGVSYEPEKLQADVKRLYGLGLFREADVWTRAAGESQIDVIYHVEERPWVSGFEVETKSPAVKDRISEFLRSNKLEIKPAAPFDPARARKIEVTVRKLLQMEKYPQAEARIQADETGNAVRVRLIVEPGRRMDVGAVDFEGNAGVSSRELLEQLTVTRPSPAWQFWSKSGAYAPEELTLDLTRLRKYYQSQGYAEAAIGEPEIIAREFSARRPWPIPWFQRSGPHLSLVIPIVEGPRFQLDSVRVEGDAKAADAEVSKIADSIRIPRSYDLSLLESMRQRLQQALGRNGYALAQVVLTEDVDSERRAVKAVYRIDAGDPVLVGKIGFTGNTRLPDRLLRRELRVAEGRVFDSQALDDSVMKLNRSGMVQEMTRNDVSLEYDQVNNAIDMVFHVKERDRQGIYGTGGTGGNGGPYLGLIYQVFNLLRMGDILSLELDGGAAQSNFLLNLATRHFLGSSFGIAFSAFHRATGVNVAEIVPSAGDVYTLFHRRSAGFQLSGSYPISAKTQLMIGIEHERTSLEPGQSDGSSTPGSLVSRSGLAPGFLFDSTRGTGPGTRGTRLAFGQAWVGNSLMTSLTSLEHSFRVETFRSDPLTKGRNAFAFHLQGDFIRPKRGIPLGFDQRLFPGSEVVRGLGRGALSPWELAPAAGATPLSPAGADTLLGFSSEYRVPVRGPLSGAAFFDLGWSYLTTGPNHSAPVETVLKVTNGLFRASVGGELRLQLPLVQTPARLIFAWNPLRLDKVFDVGTKSLRLADPRGAIRFALGNPF